MKYLCLFLISLPMSNAFASTFGHLDLEMTSNEYKDALDIRSSLLSNQFSLEDGLDEVIRVGTRNLDFLKYINSKRPDGRKLSFSSEDTQRGIPIDMPSKYNPDIIQKRYEAAVKDLPEPLKAIIFGKADFTDEPPIEETTYIALGRELSLVYQSAARWRLLAPYIPLLRARKSLDVRGYYYLSKVENIRDVLAAFSDLSDEEQTHLRQHLEGICFNSVQSSIRCRNTLESAIETNQVVLYYDRFISEAEEIYDSFFKIKYPRRDINWTVENDAIAYFPFRFPESREVETFLKTNIEDEWQWEGWNLQIHFEKDASTFIRFIAGATPNVNGLGGNRITMDANQPLDEYNVRWTIRHEFGHVLGFPDCYIEFYDDESEAMINYQIDVENLMCSRRGKLMKTHFDEMKLTYFKSTLASR